MATATTGVLREGNGPICCASNFPFSFSFFPFFLGGAWVIHYLLLFFRERQLAISSSLLSSFLAWAREYGMGSNLAWPCMWPGRGGAEVGGLPVGVSWWWWRGLSGGAFVSVFLGLFYRVSDKWLLHTPQSSSRSQNELSAMIQGSASLSSPPPLFLLLLSGGSREGCPKQRCCGAQPKGAAMGEMSRRLGSWMKQEPTWSRCPSLATARGRG